METEKTDVQNENAATLEPAQRTVKTLKAAAYNPRTITKDELARLKKAFYEFGDLSGIVFNRRSGQLVGGHQRTKVLPKNAPIEITEHLPAPDRTGTIAHGYIVLDGVKYSYREVDWDDQREKAANIAANRHGGEFDKEKLGILLQELAQTPEFDLELTGFTLGDLYHGYGTDILQTDNTELMIKLADQLRQQKELLLEMKKNMRQKAAEGHDSADAYLVIVFRDYPARKQFTDALNLPDNRYIDGRELQTLLTAPASPPDE